jgi:hypothetical protein
VRTFRPDGLLPPHDGLSELHQAVWRDGLLVVCSAGKNRLCAWTGEEWLDFAWNPADEDVDHLNSVWSDGHAWWATEFRQKGGAPSAVVWLAPNFHKIGEVEVGPCIHNGFVEGGVLWTVTGGEDAALLGIDLQTRERREAWLGQRTFVRGLARTADRWYVGNMLWDHDRERRMAYRGDAQVIVLDSDFDIIDVVTVPQCGAVAEVRALRGDRAHNGVDLEW